MLGVISPQAVPAAHIKLLDEKMTARLEEVADGLNLTDHADQCTFIGRIEQLSDLVSEEVSAANLALEYLLVSEELVIGEVCIEVRQHYDVCPSRRLHLTMEAHARRQQECLRHKHQEQRSLRTLEFREPLQVAAS
jgi:hypothetical protein